MRCLSKIVFLFVLLVATREASAREHEVSYGTAVRWIASPGFDVVSTKDSFPAIDVGLATRIMPLPILGNLWIEAQFSAASTSAESFQAFEAALSVTNWQIGARGARDLRRWLRAYVRADVGITFADLTLFSLEGGRPIADEAEAFTAYAGVGTDVAIFRASPRSFDPDLAFAFRFEVGWFASTPLSFHAHPDYPDDDTAHLDTYAAPLGSLDPSGFTLRVGITGRF